MSKQGYKKVKKPINDNDSRSELNLSLYQTKIRIEVKRGRDNKTCALYDQPIRVCISVQRTHIVDDLQVNIGKHEFAVA